MKQLTAITWLSAIFLLFIIGTIIYQLHASNTEQEEEIQSWCGTVMPSERHFESGTRNSKIGKQLFKANCATCHNKNLKDISTGPALKDIMKRWNNDEQALASYIRNAPDFKNFKAFPHLKPLKKDYPSAMTPFPYLTDDDIHSILMWMENVDNYE